jgi:hypothetical protein
MLAGTATFPQQRLSSCERTAIRNLAPLRCDSFCKLSLAGWFYKCTQLLTILQSPQLLPLL